MMERAAKIFFLTLGGVMASVFLAIVYYFVFSLVVPTDVERQLSRENARMRREIPRVERMSELVGDEIAYLEQRDRFIYRSVFKTDAPEISGMMGDMFPVEEVKMGRTIVTRNWERVREVAARASAVEDMWKEIYDTLGKGGYRLPPAISPVGALSFDKIGASVGSRMSPFYKVQVPHDGLDLIFPSGTAVLATGPGVISRVRRSAGGKGNMVEIKHSGGYVTRYAHLGDIFVREGARVRRAERIATVGDSGRAFTTHLHYEVEKDGKILDPTGFMFCSLTPDDYLNVLIMSLLSGQSLD